MSMRLFISWNLLTATRRPEPFAVAGMRRLHSLQYSALILLACVPLGCGDLSGGETAAWTAPTLGGSSTDDLTATAGSNTEGSASASQGSMSEPTLGTTTLTTGMVDETFGTTDWACWPSVCSDDFSEVLCDGEVVESCGEGTYCVDEVCTPLSACEAAELLKGSQGCNFWSVKTELLKDATGTCFAAFIANTADQPVHIEVEYDGQALPVAEFTRIPQGQGSGLTYAPYDAGAGLPVGEVAIVFLSRGPGDFPDCPAPAGIQQEVQVVGTGLGKAFRISTDQPVAAYQMLPYGGGSVAATSATLLLPTSVWDVNYMAVNAYKKSVLVPDANPLFVVVADEDGTEITLDPKVEVVGGSGVQGGPAGVPLKYSLNRGQTIQFSQPTELTGSPLFANKRVGVFGGASCLNIPEDTLACDGAHQQIPPVKALGHAYAGVRYRNRTVDEESPPWRLVGTVANTQLTWTPAKPDGAPDTLARGEVAEFNSPGPFLVQSQDADHPFYLAAYMTGGGYYNGVGDPEWVNVVPSEQFLEKYVFFTDPTYSESHLVITRSKVDGAFADVNLQCAGALAGWQPLGADYEYTRIDLVTGDFQDVGNCSNGRHEISSENPFGVTVWGWGSFKSENFSTAYVSYAYPAGARLKAINEVEVIPE